MEKVLLVCNYFAPDNTIAAIRISKLAKYLKTYGFSVNCITEKKENFPEDELLKNDMCGVGVVYAHNSDTFLLFEKVFKKMIAPIKEKKFNTLDNRKRINPKTGKIEFYPYETAYPILGGMEYLVGQIRQFDLYRSVKKYLQNADGYDYLITSYGDSFSYFCGNYFHKYHTETTWIFDIRDAIYRYKFIPTWVSLLPKFYERNIWKNADGIIGVSKGICRRVPRKYRKKVRCITNGYDWEDRKRVAIEKTVPDKLVFTFTGSMYGGLMDLSVFFQAINDLVRENKISRENIMLCFAGNASAYEIFMGQAVEHGLEDCCLYYGKLSRVESMRLQTRSDILLSASYDYKDNEGGIITGKIFEYMTAGRPVISIITGDIKNSELADIVRKTNIGIAYEASCHQNDYIRLKHYIIEQYKEKILNGAVIYQPDEGEMKKYEYPVLIKRFIRFMTKL